MPMFGQVADQVDEGELTKVESMIQSMTRDERSNPKLINKSRASRIARGCGRTVSDIEGLVSRFMQMRKMMGSLGKRGGLLSGAGGGAPGMMGTDAMDPSMLLGARSGSGATKKRPDPKARKNKRKQQQNARKKKRKK